MHIGEIVQSVLKSRFYTISPDFNDFNHFLFFQTIQHAKHVLTRKIVRFYESKHDFNNFAMSLLWPPKRVFTGAIRIVSTVVTLWGGMC